MSSYSLKKLRSESPVHDVPASAQYLSPHTSDISVNREVQSMKKGWNKKGDSNLNTECPLAAYSQWQEGERELDVEVSGRSTVISREEKLKTIRLEVIREDPELMKLIKCNLPAVAK